MNLDYFERPIKALFGPAYALVWIAFCVRLVVHWRTMSSLSHSTGIALALTFAFLWYSIFRDNDKASRLFSATSAFFATMIAVYQLF